jgi:uncharacterized protein YqhQ
MNDDINNRIQELNNKLDEIYRSVEKTRKYFMWTLIATILVVVLPLIGLMLVVPYFLNTLMSNFSF